MLSIIINYNLTSIIVEGVQLIESIVRLFYDIIAVLTAPFEPIRTSKKEEKANRQLRLASRIALVLVSLMVLLVECSRIS